MKDQNRLRIERLAARYARRVAEVGAAPEAEYLRAFDELRRSTLRPAMDEVAAELARAGHAPRIVEDEGEDRPSIELDLGLLGAAAARNRVGFAVVRRDGCPLQILAYLEPTRPRFDVERFARAADVLPERVEQLLVDAVEHLVMCNAP